jgi:dipeptidyl aminopeptidase/acylaminoacyl peptidase
VADELAKAGFVAVSIDFLGFGGSDGESFDMLEARFEKVPAVMDLLASVQALDFVDENRVGIWAHSNGGQIALSVLEILGGKMPTVLWAPMTNPFSKSVLDTADDLDDGGKLVKETIEEFEKRYDSRRYGFENYYDWMEAPILINQGTGDYWCQMDWQTEVVSELLKRGKQASLRVWPGDDHNLSRNWEEAVVEDTAFFRRHFAI